MSTFFALIFPAVLLFWAIGAYNRLVRMRNAIAQAWTVVDVPLRQVHDVVPELVEQSRESLDRGKDFLQSVVAARNQAVAAAAALRSRPVSAAAAGGFDIAEQVLRSSLDQLHGLLDQVAEAAVDQVPDPQLQQLSRVLAGAEQQLGFARQGYNHAVREYNQAVDQFPALLLARLFAFLPAAPLQSVGSAWERGAPRGLG